MWLAFVLLLLLSLPAVHTYSTGPNSCVNEPNHGSSFSANNGRFFFTLKDASGAAVTSYSPGAQHTIEINAVSGATFKGFLFSAFAGSSAPASTATSPKAGSGLTAISPNSKYPCANVLCHSQATIKTSFAASWTAPAAGSGPVYLYGIVVEVKTSYYKVELLVSEGAAPSPSNAATPSPASSVSPSPSPSPVSPSTSGSVSPSVEATSSPSPSFGSSPSNSASTAATPSVSATKSPEPSSSVSPSRSPSSSPFSYPSATALSQAATLRWAVNANANTVSYRMEAQGSRWMGIGRAACNGMLNRLLTTSDAGRCSAPVVVGRLDANNGAPVQTVLTARTTAGASTALTQSTLVASPNGALPRVWYDAAAGKTIMVFTRPLTADGGHASELPLNPSSDDGYIYAIGGDGDGFGYHQSYGYLTLRLSPPVCTAALTCSGRGSCATGAVSSCVCNVGYTGAACDRCDAGFARAVAGNSSSPCIVLPDTSGSLIMTVTMRLQLDFATTAGDPGTTLRSTFELNLRTDLSKALSVGIDRLEVKSLKAGSIVAEVAILPPSSSMTAPTAPAVALALAALAQSSSLLSASGPLLAALDTTTPLAFVSSIAGPAGGYAYTVALTSDLSLSWTVNAAAGTIAMRLTHSGPNAGSVWFAFGPSTGASMIGGDCLVYEPSKPASSQVSQQVISARSGSGVVPVPGASLPFTSSSVTTVPAGSTTASGVPGPAVVVEVVRPLAAGSYSGALPIPTSDATYVIYAIGSSGQGSVARHQPGAGVAGQLNFGSGGLVTTGASPLKVAHGVIMWIAWGLLAPAGVIIARYTKSVPPSSGPKAFWFVVHRGVQTAAAVLSIAGFVMAIVMVSPGPHFNVPHAALGLVVVLLGVWQPVNAVLRPHKPPAGQPIPFLRRAWELAHKGSGYLAIVLGAAAIFLGFQAIGVVKGSPLPGLYGAIVAAFILVFAWREAVQRGIGPWSGSKPAQAEVALTTSKADSASRKARVSRQSAGGEPFAHVNPISTSTSPSPGVQQRQSFAAKAVDVTVTQGQG